MAEAFLPLLLIIAAALLLSSVWVAWLTRHGGSGRASGAPSQPLPSKQAEKQMEQRLLGMLRGDRAVMERLIAGQGRRRGRSSRAELMAQVMLELERDRR